MFIQSGISWSLASLWRVAITPIGVLTNPEIFKQFSKINSRYRMYRIFSKMVKPEITSLYSWLLVQNYLTEYTQTIKYQENSLEAFCRYSIIGFLSMIAYKCYSKVKQSIWYPNSPSRFWLDRLFFRGLHGIIFCTASHFIKEKLE